MVIDSLELDQLVAIRDTREQRGWDLAPMKVVDGTLCTGDYSLKHLEDHLRLERKSLEDFLACCGQHRERFDREMIRLRGFKYRAVVVECTWDEILHGDWRSKIARNAVTASVWSWERRGVPIHFLGKPEYCAEWVRGYMFSVAREMYRFSTKFRKARAEA